MYKNKKSPVLPAYSEMSMKVNHSEPKPVRKRILVPHMLLAIITYLHLAFPLMASDETKGNLVTVKWLEDNLKNTEIVILDASPAKIYSSKHIPGAKNADIFTWYGRKDIPLADMEKIYQGWGVSRGKKIVMYDQGGTMLATKLFYSLYYHGFPAEDLLILDGGLFKWQEAGLPVTDVMKPIEKNGSFTITNVNEDVKANLPEFLTASGDQVNNVLVEALGADWHFGEFAPFHKAGHIPYAIMLQVPDFFNSDKTFKSAEEILKMLQYYDIKPEQTIYTHCGGGVAASLPFFAIKFLVGYPKVKLYKESQLGWLSDERDLPYWTYDAPFLLRETSWLQFWSGQMIRSFGGATVSIVDVRSSEEFFLGHVPFAVNIPVEIFQSHRNNPSGLAEYLENSGINDLDEAVVVSGAGLTKDAALAFLLLERLGQKKVSVFIEPLEKWNKPGFALTKDSTKIGSKKPLSTLTMAYPGRCEVIVSDHKKTNSIYPRVMIASGESVPINTPEGTIVHVSYTDLLNEEGMPKPAKDIWNILVKAGVPIYAELVCFSDDPGEAAINYFILKLMGYPDIKVGFNE